MESRRPHPSLFHVSLQIYSSFTCGATRQDLSSSALAKSESKSCGINSKASALRSVAFLKRTHHNHRSLTHLRFLPYTLRMSLRASHGHKEHSEKRSSS